MVTKVFPSAADYDNLSRLKTEMSAEANTFDYSGIVVPKPWGYEYLWRQNAQTAIWMLHLNNEASTSLHCHIFKRTSLIVLGGQVVCSTLEDRYLLSALDAVVLEAGVFHATQAVSSEGAWVMEVETPPMKGDLARLRDRFGRAGTGYETAADYSKELSNYHYAPFKGQEQRLASSLLAVQEIQGACAAPENCDLLIPLSGPLPNLLGNPHFVAIGEAIPAAVWSGPEYLAAREVLFIGAG